MTSVLPQYYSLVLAAATATGGLTFYQTVLAGMSRKGSGCDYPHQYPTKKECEENAKALVSFEHCAYLNNDVGGVAG